jgi:hypothetical protein
VAAPATLNPAPHMCTSIQIARSATCARRRGRTGERRRWSSDRGRRRGWGRGGCIFIRPEAFRTMEHLLATRVSVPASPGRMHIHLARGNSGNGALVGDNG